MALLKEQPSIDGLREQALLLSIEQLSIGGAIVKVASILTLYTSTIF